MGLASSKSPGHSYLAALVLLPVLLRKTGCAARRVKVQVGAVTENYTRENMTIAARETAARLSVALGGGGLAAQFVRRYAEANHRRALLAHPARHRELIERIGREALLALAASVEKDLPRRLGIPRAIARRENPRSGGGSGLLREAQDAVLANHFRVEFYGRLAELFDWDRAELEDFWRDLDLYTRVVRAPRPRKLWRGARRRKTDRHLGAFADRCAFLLDSSLLERARRAAAELHGELERTARRAVSAGFRDAGIGRTSFPAKQRHGTKHRIRRRKKTKGKKRVSRKPGGRR